MTIQSDSLAKNAYSKEEIEQKDAVIGEKNAKTRKRIEDLKMMRELEALGIDPLEVF